MAALVMLRSPKGVVKAVDPDSFDVAGALAAGFQHFGNERRRRPFALSACYANDIARW